MKRLFSALVLALVVTFYAAAAYAIGTNAFVQYGAIPAVDTTVTFKRYCKALQIRLDASSADLYVELNNNTATVGGATCIKIPSGTSWESHHNANLGVNSIHVIGSAATGNYCIVGY